MKKINFTNFALCLLTLFAFQAQAQYNGVAYQNNTPQVGAIIGVPVQIEFENYDALSSDPTGDGGNFSDDTDDIPTTGLGTYNDKSAGGASGGNSVRTNSDVDFKTGGTGHVLTSVQGNEYVIYTINVVQAGTYNLGVNYAHGGSSKDIKVYSHATDGTGKTSLYSSLSDGGIPATGNSSTYATNTLGSFTLPAGALLIRVRILDSGPNFDFFTLTLAGDDYNGVAYQNTIPQVGATVGATTTIEFENYDALSSDANGDGYNYNDPTNDLTPGITGTYYDDSPGGHSGGNTARATSDVDIKAGGSGDVVTDVKPNEYIVYTVNVVTAGNYELGMNYSHGGTSKDIEVYYHFTDATGKTLLYESDPAGGLPTSSYVTEDNLGTFDLPAGTLLIRIRFLDSGPSFDFFTLKLLTASTDYQGVAYQGNIPQVGVTVGTPVQIELEHYDALSSLPNGDGANFNDPTDDIQAGLTGTYYDASAGGNTGGNSVRTDSDVDIKAGGTGNVITDVAPNEYMVYTINVVQAGDYHMGVHYAHGGSSKDIKVYSHNATDGSGKTLLYDTGADGGTGLPATGNSSTYATEDMLGSFSLPAGPLLIRFRILDGGPNFDYFTLTLVNVVPVEMTYFKAEASAEGNILKWETATEEQNEGFEVQRSNDGKSWETLDFVEGNGTTYEVKNYTYMDNAPLNGMNYYRLKQMDFDGQFEYSKIVNVALGIEDQTNVSIYPNPVQNELTISEGIGNITIFNALGQPIRQLTNNDALTTISTADLPKGIYILRLEQTNGTFVTRQFIK